MKSFVALLATAALVAAHGYVDNATIGGQFYQVSLHARTRERCCIDMEVVLPTLHGSIHGSQQGESVTKTSNQQCVNKPPQPARISRSIPGNGPVENLSLIDVQCNTGATPAPLHAPAEAGSTVTLRWTLWPDSHMGPVLTYMARCPDTGCHSWSPGTAYVFRSTSSPQHVTDRGQPGLVQDQGRRAIRHLQHLGCRT